MSTTLIRIFCGVIVVTDIFAPAYSRADDKNLKQNDLTVLQQTDGLPQDFLDHVFDVPLATRVQLNGKYLGDATIVLTRQNTLQLVNFTEVHESQISTTERQLWATYLEQPRGLGACKKDCANGLMALDYSLDNSQLSIVTLDAEENADETRFHTLPESGSHGLLVQNRLNVFADQQQNTAGSYNLELTGSVGNWTTLGSYQLDRSAYRDAPLRQSVHNLYTQREIENNFLRLGYFTPSFQGVAREPNAPGESPGTVLGMMLGSSDNLRIDRSSPSLYPIFVTANRQGTVEIYRDGSLISTQRVEPGLQALDTRDVPSGIYEVEIRLMEDGKLTSTQTDLINKPNHWRDGEERWRYSAYAGQQHDLIQSGYASQKQGSIVTGGAINYLVHPRVVLGAMARHDGSNLSLGSSLEWYPAEKTNLYTNVYHSSAYGMGMDVQAMQYWNDTTLMANHSRSWLNSSEKSGQQSGSQSNSGLSLNQRIDNRNSIAARASQNHGVSGGPGFDLSWDRRQSLFGNDATLRMSVFDRPMGAQQGNKRNQGMDLTLSLSLGSNRDRSLSASLGSRSASDGGRDHYASVGLSQKLDGGLFTSANGSMTVDRYGLGLSAGSRFEHDLTQGDLFVQNSSLSGDVSGGLNMQSLVAVGGGSVSATGQAYGHQSGVIVDIESDVPDVELRADHRTSSLSKLKPGRHFIPVSAWKAGYVQLDFDRGAAPNASIHPSSFSYHLNRGGVSYQKVKVMETVTVIGHLLDDQGEPLRGAQVKNHAGRSVTEHDGFFSLEMSAHQPTLEVNHPEVMGCQFRLAGNQYPRENNTVMAGKLSCPLNPALAQQRSVDASNNG